MMTNERLMFEAARALWTADRIVETSWRMGFIRPRGARRLALEARRLAAAAQELENRARGMQPPREGN